MPTTVQAHPHGLGAIARNSLKRLALPNLWRFIACGRSAEWPEIAKSLLGRALGHGGVFHLWGHSWELEEHGQWQRLEDVLKFMSDYTREAPPLTNGEVCHLHATSHASVATA